MKDLQELGGFMLPSWETRQSNWSVSMPLHMNLHIGDESFGIHDARAAARHEEKRDE